MHIQTKRDLPTRAQGAIGATKSPKVDFEFSLCFCVGLGLGLGTGLLCRLHGTVDSAPSPQNVSPDENLLGNGAMLLPPGPPLRIYFASRARAVRNLTGYLDTYRSTQGSSLVVCSPRSIPRSLAVCTTDSPSWLFGGENGLNPGFALLVDDICTASTYCLLFTCCFMHPYNHTLSPIIFLLRFKCVLACLLFETVFVRNLLLLLLCATIIASAAQTQSKQ